LVVFRLKQKKPSFIQDGFFLLVILPVDALG